MTDEDISIEYEAVQAEAGEPLKVCPNCQTETYQQACPYCPDISLTGDTLADDLFARLEAGEEVDLNQLAVKKKAIMAEEFEPISFGDINHG